MEMEKVPAARPSMPSVRLVPFEQAMMTTLSLIHIYIEDGAADLSRRALVYPMSGLSFREYLKLFHKVDAPTY